MPRCKADTGGGKGGDGGGEVVKMRIRNSNLGERQNGEGQFGEQRVGARNT